MKNYFSQLFNTCCIQDRKNAVNDLERVLINDDDSGKNKEESKEEVKINNNPINSSKMNYNNNNLSTSDIVKEEHLKSDNNIVNIDDKKNDINIKNGFNPSNYVNYHPSELVIINEENREDSKEYEIFLDSKIAKMGNPVCCTRIITCFKNTNNNNNSKTNSNRKVNNNNSSKKNNNNINNISNIKNKNINLNTNNYIFLFKDTLTERKLSGSLNKEIKYNRPLSVKSEKDLNNSLCSSNKNRFNSIDYNNYCLSKGNNNSKLLKNYKQKNNTSSIINSNNNLQGDLSLAGVSLLVKNTKNSSETLNSCKHHNNININNVNINNNSSLNNNNITNILSSSRKNIHNNINNRTPSPNNVFGCKSNNNRNSNPNFSQVKNSKFSEYYNKYHLETRVSVSRNNKNNYNDINNNSIDHNNDESNNNFLNNKNSTDDSLDVSDYLDTSKNNIHIVDKTCIVKDIDNTFNTNNIPRSKNSLLLSNKELIGSKNIRIKEINFKTNKNENVLDKKEIIFNAKGVKEVKSEVYNRKMTSNSGLKEKILKPGLVFFEVIKKTNCGSNCNKEVINSKANLIYDVSNLNQSFKDRLGSKSNSDTYLIDNMRISSEFNKNYSFIIYYKKGINKYYIKSSKKQEDNNGNIDTLSHKDKNYNKNINANNTYINTINTINNANNTNTINNSMYNTINKTIEDYGNNSLNFLPNLMILINNYKLTKKELIQISRNHLFKFNKNKENSRILDILHLNLLEKSINEIKKTVKVGKALNNDICILNDTSINYNHCYLLWNETSKCWIMNSEEKKIMNEDDKIEKLNDCIQDINDNNFRNNNNDTDIWLYAYRSYELDTRTIIKFKDNMFELDFI